ncbi:hypothetical protein IMZ48_27920, partial [Candidatus Bathyarchaeota archaeon]|nr:hypothetical protein [Candidatus Bathyarchaeota archaeon]
MHEMCLHSDDFDNMKGCWPTTRLDDGLANMKTPTVTHVDAVIAAYSAVTGMFEAFMAMEIASLRALPVFNLVRISYAVVVLIKIYFTAAAPNSELGRVLPKEAIRVDHYLDSMLSKFMAAAAEDKCRPAGKFLVVLIMLRGWLNNKTGNDREKRAFSILEPEPEKSSAPSLEPRLGRGDNTPALSRACTAARAAASQDLQGPPSSGQTQPQGFVPYPATANTPLQMLSEVATGDSSMGGRAVPWQVPFFPAGGGAGLGPMDVAGPMAPQWRDTASGMGYMLGDSVDWEGMAMNFGVGISSEQEYEIMNMMTELNKPWGE